MILEDVVVVNNVVPDNNIREAIFKHFEGQGNAFAGPEYPVGLDLSNSPLVGPVSELKKIAVSTSFVNV